MVPKILIVDDDPDMVELLRLGLTEAGYSTRTAITGKEALQKAKRFLPDLMVLDLLLPDMNGFSVCQQLRRNPPTAAIPILMITVLPGQFPRLVGVEAGANAYLNKPFRVEELVSCVGDLLRQPGVVSEVLAAPRVSSATEAFPAFPVAPPGPGTFFRLGTRV
ncbi:MAG: response regulator [Verrucomicrobiota bacterium]|jgi:DNA-binding response OmpR family regulator